MGSAALLNVVLNLWFIPAFGIIGAVYASIVAHSIAVVLSAILGRLAFRLPSVYGDACRLLFAALAMAIALFVVPSGEDVFGLVLSIAVGGGVYFWLCVRVEPRQGKAIAKTFSCSRRIFFKRVLVTLTLSIHYLKRTNENRTKLYIVGRPKGWSEI